jgi:hypothetical protein
VKTGGETTSAQYARPNGKFSSKTVLVRGEETPNPALKAIFEILPLQNQHIFNGNSPTLAWYCIFG